MQYVCALYNSTLCFSSLYCASTRGRSVPSSQYLCQVGLDSRPLLRPHWASVQSRDPISCRLIGCGRFATHPPHTTTYKRKLALDRQIYLRLKLGLLGTLKLATLTLVLQVLHMQQLLQRCRCQLYFAKVSKSIAYANFSDPNKHCYDTMQYVQYCFAFAREKNTEKT